MDGQLTTQGVSFTEEGFTWKILWSTHLDFSNKDLYNLLPALQRGRTPSCRIANASNQGAAHQAVCHWPNGCDHEWKDAEHTHQASSNWPNEWEHTDGWLKASSAHHNVITVLPSIQVWKEHYEKHWEHRQDCGGVNRCWRDIVLCSVQNNGLLSNTLKVRVLMLSFLYIYCLSTRGFCSLVFSALLQILAIPSHLSVNVWFGLFQTHSWGAWEKRSFFHVTIFLSGTGL